MGLSVGKFLRMGVEACGELLGWGEVERVGVLMLRSVGELC